MHILKRHSALIGDRAIGLLDKGLLLTYAGIRFNTRLAMNLLLATLPLMMLLVGSCKTSDIQNASAQQAVGMEYRNALFPDREVTDAGDYHPAAGYVMRARKLMENNPAALKRLTQQEVSYMFGRPEMVRHDADARIWQYKNGGCVVDFYFYSDASRKDMNVAYVDYRFGGMTPAQSNLQQGRCLHKIAKAKSPTMMASAL